MKKLYYRLIDKIQYPFLQLREAYWKVKDYDRIQSDYCEVLCYATGSMMSKSNYLVYECKSQLDQYQERFYNGILKSDLEEILKDGGTVEDVKEYLSQL